MTRARSWWRTRRAILGIVLASSLPGPTLADVNGCTETLGPASAAALKPGEVLLAIQSPRAGESLARSTPNDLVSVAVDYWGPRLLAADSAHAIDDDHLAFMLDQDAKVYVGTLRPVPVCAQHVVQTAARRASFNNVPPGSHVLTVLLLGSNNVSVQPPVATSVTFIVT